MNEINKTTGIEKIKETAKKLADEVVLKMEELGINRLGPVYLKHYHNNTYGTQTRLHIDGDEYESDLVFCRRIDNSHSVWYEHGDFGLDYIRPDFETVMLFLDSIDEINAAIDEINKKIVEVETRNYKIK